MTLTTYAVTADEVFYFLTAIGYCLLYLSMFLVSVGITYLIVRTFQYGKEVLDNNPEKEWIKLEEGVARKEEEEQGAKESKQEKTKEEKEAFFKQLAAFDREHFPNG